MAMQLNDVRKLFFVVVALNQTLQIKRFFLGNEQDLSKVN